MSVRVEVGGIVVSATGEGWQRSREDVALVLTERLAVAWDIVPAPAGVGEVGGVGREATVKDL